MAQQTKKKPAASRTTKKKPAPKPAPAADAKDKEKEKETGDGAQADKDKEKEKEKEKDKTKEKAGEREAKTASLKPEEIKKFTDQPEPMQALLRYALELTTRNLTYKTASADPDAGGTDCSGFVYHILQKHGHTGVPRQSNEMYEWTWKAGTFRACNGLSMNTFEFKELQPGDLLFWTNTTRGGKTDRDPPVTHVMIYLGLRASDGLPVCAGSSDGRSYDGQRMCGVSVFDFKLPARESTGRFIGYAHLPAVKKEK